MSIPILRIAIRFEQDIVLARQRARTIAELLGFDAGDQTRISTAVSEIARNAFRYAGGGEVLFQAEGEARPQVFVTLVKDRGPGIPDVDAILESRFRSTTGMGLGITGARRLMDSFHL
ncbi:MAG: anti-sigma regulatory factor, partial [Acidobacteria bacterium]|nr:anti-sigma regulatory factor [Acidobacteriota bacterium]